MHTIKFKNTGSIFYKVNVKNVHMEVYAPARYKTTQRIIQYKASTGVTLCFCEQHPH